MFNEYLERAYEKKKWWIRMSVARVCNALRRHVSMLAYWIKIHGASIKGGANDTVAQHSDKMHANKVKQIEKAHFKQLYHDIKWTFWFLDIERIAQKLWSCICCDWMSLSSEYEIHCEIDVSSQYIVFIQSKWVRGKKHIKLIIIETIWIVRFYDKNLSSFIMRFLHF